MSQPINTHGLIVEFGKHKGERWTRVPFSYLKWILNDIPPEQEAYKIAEAEMVRRGDTMPTEVEVSNHAIDRASLRVRKAWHLDRGKDEGLYSWIARISAEALAQFNSNGEEPERVKYKGCKIVFTYGNHFPSVKTIMRDTSFKFEDAA